MKQKILFGFCVSLFTAVSVFVYVRSSTDDRETQTALMRCVEKNTKLLDPKSKPAGAISFTVICKEQLRNN